MRPNPADKFIRRTPPGDNRERMVCPDCGFIDYVNPRVVVGVVARRDDRILLVRRAIEPSRGKWTVPAGFLEEGEGTAAGAARECFEEALVRVQPCELLGIYDVPQIAQVLMFYRAELGAEEEPGAGPESMEAGLFTLDEALALDLAFPSVRWILDCERRRQAGEPGPFHHPALDEAPIA